MKKKATGAISIKSALRCAIYDRVSTEGQAFNKDGSSIVDSSNDSQQQRCLDYIKHMTTRDGKKREIVEIFSDKGFSGKDTNRPEFIRMRKMIMSRELDEIYTVELSRLSRKILDYVQFADLCKSFNVRIIIISNNLDSESPYNQLVTTLLATFAEIEQENTSRRVKENANARLIAKGRINGGGEILGLDRDLENKGHFVVNQEELPLVEDIFKLYLIHGSVTRVLESAIKKGITAKKGKPLSTRIIKHMLENAKWRYRGLWYANRENEGVVDDNIPQIKRYQTVELPHGALIDLGLLDRVQEKFESEIQHKKRNGFDEYTYLLTTVLINEDGSRYYGQPGKNRQYRYYHNPNTNKRIRCDELDKAVIAEFKRTVASDPLFLEMLERAISKRQTRLPEIKKRLLEIQNVINILNDDESALQKKLISMDRVKEDDVLSWLSDSIKQIKQRRAKAEADLQKFQTLQLEILKRPSLAVLKKQSVEFLNRFDRLTGAEKRDVLEKLVMNVIVKADNKVEIAFIDEPSDSRPVELKKEKSTGEKEIGVTNGA
jgi:site-specific DNA recombinase